jgi:hypothetical protein
VMAVRLQWKGGNTIGEGDKREGDCDGRVAVRRVRVTDGMVAVMGEDDDCDG